MSNGLRVLLVRRDRMTWGSSDLERQGFRVTECQDAREALLLCLTSAFDAVVVDVGLQASEGIRLTRTLREYVPYKVLPVVALSQAGDPPVPAGSGIDLVLDDREDARTLSRAIHNLRQQRGLLAPLPTAL